MLRECLVRLIDRPRAKISGDVLSHVGSNLLCGWSAWGSVLGTIATHKKISVSAADIEHENAFRISDLPLDAVQQREPCETSVQVPTSWSLSDLCWAAAAPAERAAPERATVVTASAVRRFMISLPDSLLVS